MEGTSARLILGATRRVQECAVNFFLADTLPTLGLFVRFPLRVGNRGKRGKPGLYGEASSVLRATPIAHFLRDNRRSFARTRDR